jgi:hypothetical protein
VYVAFCYYKDRVGFPDQMSKNIKELATFFACKREPVSRREKSRQRDADGLFY